MRNTESNEKLHPAFSWNLANYRCFSLIRSFSSVHGRSPVPPTTTPIPFPSQQGFLFFMDYKLPCNSYYASFGPSASGQNQCDQVLNECTEYHLKDQHNSSIIYILEKLRNAKLSINMCMYRFALVGASDVLIHLKNCGVSIRIIVDRICEAADGTCINSLRNTGIEVKELGRDGSLKKSSDSRFIIIDERLYIRDDLNWVKSALVGNVKSMILSDDMTIVRQFNELFESLWQ